MYFNKSKKIEPKIKLYHSNLKEHRKNLEKTKKVIELCEPTEKNVDLQKEKINDKTLELGKIIEDLKEKNDINISLFEKLDKSLLNVLKYSTVGGLAELGKRKEIYMRIFWTIVVLICSSYALVTIIRKINTFYNYEVVLESDKFQEMPVKFPAITMCNENPFNEQKTFAYLQEKLNLTYDYGDYSLSYASCYNCSISEYAFVDIVFVKNYSSSPDDHKFAVNKFKRTLINDLNETELKTMGYNLDTDMLISCQFNGKSCSESNGDFKKFWNNIYGNCYTFNSDSNFFQQTINMDFILK